MTPRAVAVALLLAASRAGAQQPRVLSLEEAVRTAVANQPQLRQARAGTEASQARADEALAPLLPQVTGTAAYERTTANFVSRPGTVPRSLAGVSQGSSWESFNFYNFGLSVTQYVWDFGQTTNRYRASKASADAQASTERATNNQVLLTVRTTFFGARAEKDLVGVAQDNLRNQEAHLRQIQGFVEVGTRPEIDLAQARTDRANAEVQLINAENGYETAKAQLNQAMGIEGPTDYDVASETLPPIEGEDAPLEVLVEESARARPDVAAADRQVRAQELSVKAAQGGYGPSIGIATGFTDQGLALDSLAWNWSAGVTLTWPLFAGGLTRAQVAEARANLASAEAALAIVRQQVRLEVNQARLAVRAAKTALGAAEEALVNARERLRLAEGRYQTGAGSVIELGDAQVAATTAAAQRVQADFNVATARAQLVKALGRS